MRAVWTGVRSSTPVKARWRIVEESGTSIRFADGVNALDLNSGLWNVPLGYRNPVVERSVIAAMGRGSYGGQFRRSSDVAERVARRLLNLWPDQRYTRVMFGTSGSAAVDVALKLACLHQVRLGNPEQRRSGSFIGGYHGQTLGALGLSDEELMQGAMLTNAGDYVKLPLDSASSVRQVLLAEAGTLCAVFIEPVQGTGNRPIPEDILAEVFAFRDAFGFLVIADEVATGFGRTGVMFRSSSWARSPDIVVLSKTLTNGTQAASALLISEPVVASFSPSDAIFPHGETQSGSLWACGAIDGVLDVLRDEYGMTQADHTLPAAGEMDEFLAALDLDRKGISVRGEGMFRTLECSSFSDGVLAGERLRARGLVVAAGVNGIQLAPMYCMRSNEWDRAQTVLSKEIEGWGTDG